LRLNRTNKVHIKKITAPLKIWIENGMFARVVQHDPKRHIDKPCIEVGEWIT